jgi:hypothetical protein
MASNEAEALVEEQAVKFEQEKDYLVQVWEQKADQRSAARRGIKDGNPPRFQPAVGVLSFCFALVPIILGL